MQRIFSIKSDKSPTEELNYRMKMHKITNIEAKDTEMPKWYIYTHNEMKPSRVIQPLEFVCTVFKLSSFQGGTGHKLNKSCKNVIM